MVRFSLFFSLAFPATIAVAQLTSSSLEKHPNVLALTSAFDPVKAAYWTALPHHRRTPFAVSPDGKSAYLAYLDNSETDVHIQGVDPSTFAAVGPTVTVKGAKEAGGLVAQDDGFALLTNLPITSVSNAPPSNTPVPVIVRYKDGQQAWKTFLGGPGVHADFGLAMAPDLNGDIVYSNKSGLYGAYFVVTDYTGPASGHFGDSIEYVDDSGDLKVISGASSSWGCSHNTGIAFEAADTPPYASICAEDHDGIWLNTDTQGMAGKKIANENAINGADGEPMGGMSGSYSALANFPGSTQYIFAWASRGAVNLTQDTWLGAPYTNCSPRRLNHNVAISLLKDKSNLVGPEASSTVGAASGDDQVNWITTGSVDRSNVHVATFDGSNALVTWEEIASPTCDNPAMGCSGTFTGSYFQQVDNTGKKLGSPISAMDVFVAGDIVNMGTGKLCWPYVDMAWDLSLPVGGGLPVTSTTHMSFACVNIGDSNGTPPASASTGTPSETSSATPSATSSATPSSSVSTATPSESLSSNTSSGTPSATPSAKKHKHKHKSTARLFGRPGAQ